MNRVEFFTKAGCHLCQAAMFIVKKVRQDLPFELQCIDIAAPGNERWAEQYGEHIPVIHLNGREICRHRVDEGELRRLLNETDAPRGGRDGERDGADMPTSRRR